MRLGKLLCYLPGTMAGISSIIRGGLGRIAWLGLWLLLSPQLIMMGGAWDGGASAEPSPLQSHEQLPGEPGETEEITEDGDERLAWQAGLAAIDAGILPDTSVLSALDRSASASPALLDRFLFRPPTPL